jgi:hypothetical protein
MSEKPKPARKGGRQPRPEAENKSINITLRCRREWKAWLDEFGQRLALPMADVVDSALASYAHARGFRPPPKR